MPIDASALNQDRLPRWAEEPPVPSDGSLVPGSQFHEEQWIMAAGCGEVPYLAHWEWRKIGSKGLIWNGILGLALGMLFWHEMGRNERNRRQFWHGFVRFRSYLPIRPPEWGAVE